MKILGLIPARGGSKGVPRKNIKLLAGKPLLAYTTEAALSCNQINTVALSSEDNEIIEIAKRLGIEVPYKRPTELAQDNTPTLPVIQHMLEHYASLNQQFDAVCLLQATSPFRSAQNLTEAIKKFIDKGYDSLISVTATPHQYNPHWAFTSKADGSLQIATGEKEIIARRQELPPAYIRNGAIYLTRADVIQRGSLYGNSIGYYEMGNSINIDTEEDWQLAEAFIKTSTI